MKSSIRNSIFNLVEKTRLPALNSEGAVGVPILMWLLGVPGILVILLWVFFFRG